MFSHSAHVDLPLAGLVLGVEEIGHAALLHAHFCVADERAPRSTILETRASTGPIVAFEIPTAIASSQGSRASARGDKTGDAIQQKLDRLDEAFLFQRSIDIETYDRHAERLREELTLARIAKHSTELDELDVEGILAFAERVLPRAADLWVQAPLEQRQRFQQLLFPDGMTFDGQRFVGTTATAPAFSYLREIRTSGDGVVDQTRVSWNQIAVWLGRLAHLQHAF